MAFRIAVIGLGKIARDQHLPCIAGNRDFELAAVVSARGGGVDGVPCFRTTAELLTSGLPLDAAALCMPPEPRFAVACATLDAGLGVLCEKPPTPTVGELRVLAVHAHARRRVLFTAWHSQYNAGVDVARQWLQDRTVRRLEVVWKESVRRWHPDQAWIWDPGGFGVFDPGINAFSILTRILPQPVFVADCTLMTPANRATPIAARIRFGPSWQGDADLTAELDWRQEGRETWSIRVVTTDGRELLLARGGAELVIDGEPGVALPPREYHAIYERFAELLRTGRSHVDAAPLELVADCLMRGRRIEVEPFG